MILRRVMEHVRTQNWTAVALDFVIVVMGVFMGIQLGNWNEARGARAAERGFLAQLREEIVHSVEVIDYQSRYVSEVVASGRRALDYLTSGADCMSACEDLLIDFFHASQVWGTPFDYTKYREALRLGFPSDPATLKTVQDFYVYLNGWDTVNGAAPAYRERVRGHIRPDAAESLWRDCMRLPGSEFEELTRACADDLKSLDTAEMLREIRADPALVMELRFWLGQNIFALRGYPDMRRYADAAIAAISAELETN
ncbi:MAG: hypothetical protein GC152_12605 [Alphaproteobacteria bacterium]|nr:hypothetical protein [Alphaproteobacteria bacterium]